MTRTSGRLLLWAPRLLGAVTCLFLGLFALDAFSEERTFLQALPAFAIHLAPAAFLCGIVAASWKREWVGGTVFVVCSVAYIGLARGRLDWVLLVSGPLLVVGTLFLLSWRLHDKLHTSNAR
jgi:O-antigen ligase